MMKLDVAALRNRKVCSWPELNQAIRGGWCGLNRKFFPQRAGCGPVFHSRSLEKPAMAQAESAST